MLLCGLWLGPLTELSGRVFSLHMILHLATVSIAAPLIAIGLSRIGLGLQTVRPGIKPAIAASAFDMFMISVWHAPALHEAAARHTGVFVFQQVSFLTGALLVWAISFAGRARGNAAIGAFALLATFMHMTMLGVLIALAPDLIYAPDVCIGAFGLDPLRDQKLGGVLMAVFGGFSYLVGGLVLMRRLIGDRETAST